MASGTTNKACERRSRKMHPRKGMAGTIITERNKARRLKRHIASNPEDLSAVKAYKKVK